MFKCILNILYIASPLFMPETIYVCMICSVIKFKPVMIHDYLFPT